MPALQQDYSQIKANQEKAASLNKQAAGMESTAFTLPDTVMNAVRTDRTTRGVSKLATDVGNVMGQMVTDPTQIREGPQSLSAQGMVDPFSVNQLTSNARAQNLRTLGTISTQETANQGSLDQVIQAGANQLKARAATMLAQAEQATAMATSLQQEWERGITEREMSLKERSAGGSDWGSILNDWLEKNNGTDDFQEEPLSTDARNNRSVAPAPQFNAVDAFKALLPNKMPLFNSQGLNVFVAGQQAFNWAKSLIEKRKKGGTW